MRLFQCLLVLLAFTTLVRADGVSVEIAPTQAQFALNEPLGFKYTFTNTDAKREFAIYNKLFDRAYDDDRTFDQAAALVVTNTQTKAVWRVTCTAEISRKRNNFPTVTLAPGQKHQGIFEFEQFLSFLPQGGGKPLKNLPPGQYQLNLTWKFPPVPNSKVAWYSGDLTANPIEFKIDDKPSNELTEAQKKEGWKLLFDGKTLAGWRGFKMKDLPASWDVRSDAIFCNGRDNVDLLSVESFGDFEMSIDWKISAGGNSGILLRTVETTNDTASNALEIQVIDTSEGWKAVHGGGLGAGQEAGALYGLYPAKKESIRLAGEWNNVKVKMVGSKIRVEQNGVTIADADMSSDDWKDRLGKSKFAKMEHFNKAMEGHIALQNYRGAGVWYRNIMVRPTK